MLSTAKTHARKKRITELLSIDDCLNSLTFDAFGGESMGFPLKSSDRLKSRESQLLSLVDDALDNIHIDTDDRLLTARFTQPENLVHLANESQAAAGEYRRSIRIVDFLS